MPPETKYHDKLRPLASPAAYEILETADETYSWETRHVDQIERAAQLIATGDYYRAIKNNIKAGNNKIHKNTWIWSVSPATDCPHLGGKQCQVPKEACYAYSAEQQYSHSADSPGGPLHLKRRQTLIWDLLDARTFAETLIEIKSRKTGKVDIEYLRLNEAGDIRSYHDVHKANEIARILKAETGVQTYLYSATYQVPGTGEPFEWPAANDRHFNLMASNDRVGSHADARFRAKLPENIDDDDLVCPAEKNGRDNIKCGECRLCPDALVDEVVVPIH